MATENVFTDNLTGIVMKKSEDGKIFIKHRGEFVEPRSWATVMTREQMTEKQRKETNAYQRLYYHNRRKNKRKKPVRLSTLPNETRKRESVLVKSVFEIVKRDSENPKEF